MELSAVRKQLQHLTEVSQSLIESRAATGGKEQQRKSTADLDLPVTDVDS